MQMLAVKEENRISWEELFVHPYFMEKEKSKQEQEELIQNV